MRFEIDRASTIHLDDKPPIVGAQKNEDGDWYIDVPDLESLLALSEAVRNELIVSHNRRIIIYDDYLE